MKIERGFIRPPAVAGQFYPADPDRLRRMVTGFLESAESPAISPKAVIAPHAGYVYSGPVAGSAYACLEKAGDAIRRVVLLGPCHRVPVRGLALSQASAFATPLGLVPLDQEANEALRALPQVVVSDAAHAAEHSLEVQLPFLQTLFSEFRLVPLAVGEAYPEEVSEVLAALWGGSETVVVISSDLSHYLNYETAKQVDRVTSRAIEECTFLREGQACGRIPVNGLLQIAREKKLSVQTVDLRNSGDTSGSRGQVVGYGAFVFSEPFSGMVHFPSGLGLHFSNRRKSI